MGNTASNRSLRGISARSAPASFPPGAPPAPPATKLLGSSPPRHKFGLWRRLWLELARCEKELGLDRISEEAIQQLEAKLDDIDFDSAAKWEKRLRHDVMAHVHAYEEV